MIVRNADDVGALLREARRSQQMTQSELADATGVSRQWVITVEQGAPTARLDLVLAALNNVGLLVDLNPAEPDDTIETIMARAGA